MSNIIIKIFDDEILPEMKCLLENIYKDNPEIINKLTYCNNAQNHVLTVVAIARSKIIGQANIFQKPRLQSITNIGYHVHKKYRDKGIATKLAQYAIDIAKTQGYSSFHIITEENNVPACHVAEKLKFNIDSSMKIKGMRIYNKYFG